MQTTSGPSTRALLILLVSSAALRADEGGADFDRVRTVLTGKCLSCHGGQKQKGGLDLSRRDRALAGGESGPAVVPGKPSESLLYRKLAAGEMPPSNPLSPEQLAAFTRWIEHGATYPREPLTSSVARAGSAG